MPRFFKNYFFSDTPDNSRFQAGDEPTESEFHNLFDSIAFIREKSDTAKLNEQGLAKCTEDNNAINRDSSEGPDQMTRFAKAHQLPNVIAPLGSGIKVDPINQTTGRTGGTGKDFQLTNMHRFTAVAPIVITSITDSTTGAITFTFTLNQSSLNALESGKVKVFGNDTTSDYLFNKITSLNPNLTGTILNPGGNEILALNLVERVGEVKMFFGDVTTVFAGGYNNTVNDVWRGWALCNGNTYNSVLTPDMRGFVPIGYNPDVTANPKYSTIGDHQDDTTATGENTHTLSKAEIPLHTHVLDNGVDGASQSDPGDHYHSYSHAGAPACGGDEFDAGGADYCVNRADTTGPEGAHTHSGNTGNGFSDGLNGDPHENRQPFTVLAFIMYVGY